MRTVFITGSHPICVTTTFRLTSLQKGSVQHERRGLQGIQNVAARYGLAYARAPDFQSLFC